MESINNCIKKLEIYIEKSINTVLQEAIIKQYTDRNDFNKVAYYQSNIDSVEILRGV